MNQTVVRALRLILLSIIFTGALSLRVPAQTRERAPAKGQAATLDRDFELDPIETGEAPTMKVFALRLRPGQDLRHQIEAFVRARQLRAGFVITTVGSLRRAAIRLADQPSATSFDGKFEIVSLVGTLGQDGVHLHISISDNNGKTIGGHLVEGCVIYTTAEIVIGEAPGLIFSREKDPETTYQELRIRRRTRAHGPRRQ